MVAVGATMMLGRTVKSSPPACTTVDEDLGTSTVWVPMITLDSETTMGMLSTVVVVGANAGRPVGKRVANGE